MKMQEYLRSVDFPIIIKVTIALVIFSSVKNFDAIININGLIVALLEFIIVLELVRMVIEFIFSDENKIKLRYMLDSTIIFFIRDIMLIANESLDMKKISFILLIILILFVFRILAMKYSPSNLE